MKMSIYKILFSLCLFAGALPLIDVEITNLNYPVIWVLLLIEYANNAFFEDID